jgi:DNA gyrase/topoisomerase IV subunit A
MMRITSNRISADAGAHRAADPDVRSPEMMARVTSPYPTPEVQLQDMRAHLQAHEAIITAAKDAHTVLDIVLNAADPDEAIRALTDRYGFTDAQARAVTDVQVHRLTQSEVGHSERRRDQLGRSIAAREQELGA